MVDQGGQGGEVAPHGRVAGAVEVAREAVQASRAQCDRQRDPDAGALEVGVDRGAVARRGVRISRRGTGW